ncbi:hypothetical protein ZEAMMB73_Zm00001d047215 [Zea mays]|uniref:Uncharacterized protein n=1 Tax=Zea mays TaxID=4577 RepID=A0A1D6P7U7_MAIZE|nr:hypothetical protein ZEAMMB73_Zm00001d047215 [Zea mays]
MTVGLLYSDLASDIVDVANVSLMTGQIRWSHGVHSSDPLAELNYRLIYVLGDEVSGLNGFVKGSWDVLSSSFLIGLECRVAFCTPRISPLGLRLPWSVPRFSALMPSVRKSITETSTSMGALRGRASEGERCEDRACAKATQSAYDCRVEVSKRNQEVVTLDCLERMWVTMRFQASKLRRQNVQAQVVVMNREAVYRIEEEDRLHDRIGGTQKGTHQHMLRAVDVAHERFGTSLRFEHFVDRVRELEVETFRRGVNQTFVIARSHEGGINLEALSEDYCDNWSVAELT